jgi:mono/diheme cytochrome c family protein
MLGTWLFVALWVVLGLAVFAIAMRGGLVRAAAPSPGRRQSYAARRATGVVFVFVYVGFGIAMPLGFLIGNHANASAQVGGYRLTANEKVGRQVFGQHCGVCHTLAASNSIGKVGPNLDVIKPSESLVLHTILNGCLQSPPSGDRQQTCLGYGTMPASIVSGQEATDVAQFVAQVAGRE